MRICKIFFILCASIAALSPRFLSAQAVPITGLIQLDTPDVLSPDEEAGISVFSPAATALPGGRFALAATWMTYAGPGGWSAVDGTFVTFLDPLGQVTGKAILDEGDPRGSYRPGSARLAADGRGGLIASWTLDLWQDDSRIKARRFRPDGTLESAEPVTLSSRFYNSAQRIAAQANGRFVVAWEYAEPNRYAPTTIALQVFAAMSRPATPWIRLAPQDATAVMKSPRVAIDPSGRFSVLWTETTNRSPRVTLLWGQRFSRDGRSLGSPFQLPGGIPALLPNGQIAVAWNEPGGQGSLKLGWFNQDGAPAGPTVDTGTSGEAIDLATDGHGNLALLTRRESHLEVRLFNRALVPQGEPLWIEPFTPRQEWGDSASVALSDDRRLLVGWTGPSEYPQPGRSIDPLLARLWKVSHDADACVRRDHLFLCDTRGDGGEPEAAIDIGYPGLRAVPLLADWDGDGRADPCFYQNGTFSCDTTHDGSLAARSPRVGLPGDIPLLGDADGDGRADPCVRRGTLFLCDLARNGGAAELRIDFGQPGDLPLFGDADGDGRADPCVYRGRRFLCDTAHDGGAAEVILDLRSALAGSSGTPLLGDVNGDGRADPCVWRAGQLLCGVFRANGGQPLRTFERLFGEPGDVPLLGDLDAF